MRIFRKLKTCLLCLIALLCLGPGLGAQDLKAAVLEPMGGRDVKSHFSLVRNAFISTVTKTNGFQLIDRARTDQILNEHGFQRNSGLLASSEARELGKMLGVDFIFSSEVTKHDDGIEVSCQTLDIVTGEVIGSDSVVLEDASSKMIRESCEDMMVEILKTINKRATSRPSRGNPGASGGSSGSDMLSGLDFEISKAIMNNRTNAKWNKNKASYTVEVDLSGVNLSENRQSGSAVYKVSGIVSIMLTDEKSGNGSNAEVVVDEFTEMSRDSLRSKLLEQIRPKTNSIIRDLLSGLDDE